MFRTPVVCLVVAFTPMALCRPSISRASAASVPTDTCSCDFSPVPLFRAFNAAIVDHFYTTSQTEVSNAGNTGWASQGVAGLVLTTNQTGTLPLFRLFNARLGDHFYTVSSSERQDVLAGLLAGTGWIDEGIAAFILAAPACGTIPLYRSFQAAGFDHFYTTNTTEMVDFLVRLDYVYEATIGYIWPA